ncbi:MAG: hypothetical protein HY426_04645 [Candidatus Levybacteria bacterium]|nr:hypothetical protein [Candidatus Levybacteria bacterium]
MTEERIRIIDLSGLRPGEFGDVRGGIKQPMPQTDGTKIIIDMSDYFLRTGTARFDPNPIEGMDELLGDK